MDKIKKVFKGFELEIEKSGKIFFEGVELQEKNGFVVLKKNNKINKFLIFELVKEAFGVSGLANYLSIDKSIKILEENNEICITIDNKFYDLKTKREIETSEEIFSFSKDNKNFEFSKKELLEKYFPELFEEEKKVKTLLQDAKELKIENVPKLFIKGDIVFSIEPLTFYNVSNGMILVSKGSITKYISLEAVLPNG